MFEKAGIYGRRYMKKALSVQPQLARRANRPVQAYGKAWAGNGYG